MDDNVDVITNSWGEPELAVSPAAAHAESNMFMQAAATGISVLFSSGDSGDEAANLGGTKFADLPAASPWATAVGGTFLGIAAHGNIALETGWGTSKWSESGSTWVQTIPFQYGAGGGISNYFDFTQSDSPSDYQGADTSGVRRYVPDIGLDADPTTGMLIGETQRFGANAKSDAYGEYRIGGTSLASPLFAGVMAQTSPALPGRVAGGGGPRRVVWVRGERNRFHSHPVAQGQRGDNGIQPCRVAGLIEAERALVGQQPHAQDVALQGEL